MSWVPPIAQEKPSTEPSTSGKWVFQSKGFPSKEHHCMITSATKEALTQAPWLHGFPHQRVRPTSHSHQERTEPIWVPSLCCRPRLSVASGDQSHNRKGTRASETGPWPYAITIGSRAQCPLRKKVHTSSQSTVTQSCLTLRPHGLQHARPPCPSPSPGVYSNSCPLSQ